MYKRMFKDLAPGTIFWREGSHVALFKREKPYGTVHCDGCGTDKETWNASNFHNDVHTCPDTDVETDFNKVSDFVKL